MTPTGGPGEYLGTGSGVAGDVNGDGHGDVIIGAAWGEASGPGRAYVYYGGPDVDDVADLVLVGREPGEWFGYRTIGLELNGDAYPDLVVGAHYNDAAGTDAGRVYVHFGSGSPDTTADVILTGVEPAGMFGCSLADAGDMNGDGYRDLLVGARERGRAYLFFGGPAFDNVADVVLSGTPPSDWFGVDLSGAGDVNEDGFDDVLVGAANASRVYVFFGGAVVDATPDLVLVGNAGDNFGVGCAGVGDVNGDGGCDLLVGATHASSSGRAYVYFGGSVLDATPDWILDGELPGDFFGAAVGAAGDVDRDGYADIAVSAAGRANYTGHLVVFCGGPIPDATPDFAIDGENEMDLLGWTVFPAGDVDGDGHADVFVPAPLNDAGGPNAGRVYVISAPFNTQIGDGVVATPVDPATHTSPLTLTFEHVAEAGNTILDIRRHGPPRPVGYRLGVPPSYYDPRTSAVHTGTVEVCVDYSAISFRKEHTLDLFRLDGGAWLRCTASLDTLSNVICGTVESPSLLAIFEEGPRPAVVLSELEVTPNPGNGVYTFSFGLPAEGPAAISVYDVAGRRVVTLRMESGTPGVNRILWNGRSEGGHAVPRGVYFARLRISSGSEHVKFVHLGR